MKFMQMIKKEINSFDITIFHLLKKGLLFSFLLSLFAIFLLAFYESYFFFPILYHVGLSLFKTSLMFAVAWFICAIGFDTIKKEQN